MPSLRSTCSNNSNPLLFLWSLRKSYIIILLLSVLNGCTTTKFYQPVRQSFSFDYTPSDGSLAKTDGDLSFTILEFQVVVIEDPLPSFTTPGNSFLLDKLIRSLERDFSEIITAQGYGLKGPFESHSEMTYPDKEATDLILFAKVVIQVDHHKVSWGYYEDKDTGSVGIGEFSPSSAFLDISFEFHIYESLSKEKLWAKSITLDPLRVDLTYTASGGLRYASRPSFQVMLEHDNSYHAAIGELLDKEYDGIIDRMIAYLHPREMQRVHGAAKRVRAKKVY